MSWANLFNDLFAVVHLGAIGLLVAMLWRPAWRDAFERRCVGAATAIDLAWIRIVVCSILVLYILGEDLVAHARLGADYARPPGVLRQLDGLYYDLLGSADALFALKWGLVALLVLGAVGAGTRVVLPVAAVLYLMFAGLLRGWGKEFHEGYLSWYVLIVLCFLPSGDAWSVDARLRRRARDAAAYGWAVWACFAAAAIPYLQLGLSKLASGGPFWFDGTSMRNHVIVDNLNRPDGGLDLGMMMVDAPTFVWTVMGFVGLVTELLYPLVLVIPRVRRWLAAAVIALHVGIWLSQNVLFFDAVLVPAIFFVPAIWPWRKP